MICDACGACVENCARVYDARFTPPFSFYCKACLPKKVKAYQFKEKTCSNNQQR